MVARLPKPKDFRRLYVAEGWAGIRACHGVGTVTITRWIDEEGRDKLYAERAEHVSALSRRVQAIRRNLALSGTVIGAAAISDESLAARRLITPLQPAVSSDQSGGRRV